MTTIIICLSLIPLLASLWLMLMRQRPAPATAWLSLALLYFADARVPGLSTVGFWGAAAAIATAINYMLPAAVTDSRTGQGYIAGAALAGLFVGMVMNFKSAMIVGAIAGALIGALAFSRTRSGATIAHPFRKFINYVCAKGMSAVITAVIAGITISYIISLTNS